MRFVLDTHIWIWSLVDPTRLTPDVRSALADADHELWLSSISVWEALVLIRKGRLKVRGTDGQTWIAEALGPLRLHSCGPSSHLLASMKKISRLASLDLGGETSISKVREVFGKDFPIDVMPITADFYVDSSEPILKWAEQVIEENAGGPLRILYHLEPDYNLENVRALIDYAEKR